MGKVIAIVTPELFAVSETFITQHILELAPKNTVVVCFDRERVCDLGFPVHCALLPDREHLPFPIKKAAGLYSLLFSGSSAALSSKESERLVEFFVRNGVSIVMAEYGPTACAVSHVCKKLGLDLFVHFHGYDASLLLAMWHYRYSYLRLMRYVMGIICPSTFICQKLEAIGMPAIKMHVIPYGVDEIDFKPAQTKDENLVLAVGRFVEKKAPNLTIEAFARVAALHPTAKLEMVGDGYLLEECRRMANQLGIGNRVTLHGSKDHDFVRNIMARAVMLVQHSVITNQGDTEGLPVGILEAMASGLPVISTRHAGIPEAVIEGETGLLVDEHDVDSMAGAMDTLLSNPGLRKSMGRAGRKRAIEKFSTRQTIQRLRQVLDLHAASN